MKIKINKKYIASILADLLIVGLCSLLGASMYYNYVLQEQIEERDKIIHKLSTNSDILREKILNKYFDIEYDSISSVEIFTLKDNYISANNHNQIVKNITSADSIEYTHLIKDYNLLVDKYNNMQKMYENNEDTLITEYNTLITQYNILFEKNKKIANEIDSIYSITKSQESALKLIEKNFSIRYTSNISGNKIKVSLLSEKADSAFLLLPYFRDRLQYDSLKKCWIIETKRPFWKK